MDKHTQKKEDGFLSEIISLIDKGEIDEFFNETNFIEEFKAYKICANMISVEMLEDIKANTDHYRQFIGVKK
jgi:hypothetical protein